MQQKSHTGNFCEQKTEENSKSFGNRSNANLWARDFASNPSHQGEGGRDRDMIGTGRKLKQARAESALIMKHML